MTITDQLSSNLNWNTFDLTEIGFGDDLIAVPANSQHYETTLPMNYNGKTSMSRSSGFNAATGEVSATFQSLDPNTDLPPDVLTGFLPPEDGTGRGMGISLTPSIRRQILRQVLRSPMWPSSRLTASRGIATDQINPHDPSTGHRPCQGSLNTIDASHPFQHRPSPSSDNQ